MVRDDIEQQTHPALPKLARDPVKFLFSPEFPVHVRGIGHVISVHAPRARLILRRRIQMRDPQLLKIREQIPGVRKAEIPIELYPVCRRWNLHGSACNAVPTA